MESLDLDKATPENYSLELARTSSLIKQYDRAIQSLEQPPEIELEPGSIIYNCLDLTYSTCNHWEGIEAYIIKEKGEEEETGLYVAIPDKHYWYKESKFNEKPLSVIRMGKWALYQFQVRKYQNRITQHRYLTKKLRKLVTQVVQAKG